MNYTELHLHTSYSLLDGLNTADEYMKRAGELGMTHMAVTDHGVLSGHRDFQKAAKSAGIKPILGCEMYISELGRTDRTAVKKVDDNVQAYNHLIVLAQDENGLRNLNRLSELAWTEGFYSKPRIDMEILEEHQEGLIVLSGCLNGLIAKAIANGEWDKAANFTNRFKRIFGDRFFMEVQQHNPYEINSGLLTLADQYKVRPVLTSDCHYSRQEDLWLEEAMLILATNPKPNKEFNYSKAQKMDMLERFNYAYPDRKMTFQEFGLFLHSAQDHLTGKFAEQFGGRVVEAVSNTMVVAEMIGDYPYHEGLDLLPRPKNGDPDELLERKVIQGAKKRGTFGIPEYDARRKEELDIIKAKDFSTYFLIEANAVQWGKGHGILFGPGRGSGAGSLVNYELEVTEVDPIKYNLLFFRFINPERNDYPDIDTDVEVHRRSELKSYLQRKFKHVASIATFGTFAGKNSVRDASRVFMVPLGDVNKALKGADWPANMDFFDMWEKTERGITFKRKYPEVVDLAKFMYGRLRTQGMHAGGLVVSNEPISNYAPMQSAKDNSDPSGQRIPLVAVDMEAAAEIGLIKYDWLGLKALSIISDTLRMIKERHDQDIVLTEIPLDEKKIYKSLSDGYTRGSFQCEATPYTNLLMKMKVENFDELVASNALVRPGAADSSAGASYLARKHGQEMVEYIHPDTVEFTKDTYGVVIYQEQVMQTMTELAGMPMATADKVRKIIGKKKDVREFEQYKAEFIEGARKKVSTATAERLWHDFEAHAGYSFNKSHAVAYSMLSYWTAWFKEHYPLEFMTALLRNENDKDSLLDYLMEAKRMGIRMVLPHVNSSGIDFEIQSDEKGEYIRFGLSNIKYISGKIGGRLLDQRPYNSYAHLQQVATTKGSGISSRTIGSLNKVGAAVFPDNPRSGTERDNFFEYLNIPSFAKTDLHPWVRAQFRPLEDFDPEETFVSLAMVRGIKTGANWTRIEIVDETGSAGVFTGQGMEIESGNMYVFLISKNSVLKAVLVDELTSDQGGAFQEFLEAKEFPEITEGFLRVVAFSPRITSTGKKMADVVFCDGEKNLIGALAFPQMFTRAFVKLHDEGKVVEVDLKQTKDGTAFIDNIW